MSGHDIADKPHETTHEMVWDMGDTAHMAGEGRKPLPPSHVHREHITASVDGSLRGIPHVSECRGSCGQKPPCSNCADVRIPVQWTRWPNVKPREVPATERRQGPRVSRFNDLEQTR